MIGHRDKDGEISSKHGNTLVQTLRKMYGHRFATGFADTDKLSEVYLFGLIPVANARAVEADPHSPNWLLVRLGGNAGVGGLVLSTT